MPAPQGAPGAMNVSTPSAKHRPYRLPYGLGPLAEELRGIEQDDAACLRYPRFKASDDASAIWLRVG